MRVNRIFLSILIGFSISISAQVKLTFDKALELTLANNYDILMANVNQEIAENSATKSNNGFLPSVTASGAYNWTYYNGENELVSETRTFDANNSYNYNAGIFANYTLFNGFGRKFSFLQSKGNLKLTKLQMQQIIQNSILELSRIYHEVARLEESVESLEKLVAISKDRYVRAEYNYDYGQTNKLGVLNAKVDLNTDSISLINGIQELANLKRNLNFLMGQEVSQEIMVDKEVETNQIITEAEVILGAEEKNIQLQLLKANLDMNQFAISTSKSNWLPNVGANAGYLYQGTDNPNGVFAIGSKNYGPQAGLSLSWNLFNGQNNVAVKNAKLRLTNIKIEQQSIQQSVKSDALNLHTAYRNLLFILRSQTDNVATATDNFIRSEDSFKRGIINSIEFRQAQLNLLNAEQALSRAKYDAKNAEYQVMAVMGELVK